MHNFISYFLGDGAIQEYELEEMIRACAEENALHFPDSDISALATVLYKESLGDRTDTEDVNIDMMKHALKDHHHLVDTMTIR